MSEPHQVRHVAESFGIDAERYDRSRPRYPAELIDRIATVSPGPEVVEVGCGTGIASRQLQAAGLKVLGVEPDARMASFARDRGLDVEVSTFEAWESACRTFDAVVAAQCWHWVAPVAGAVKAAQVLRPGGLMAVFWNVDRPQPELAEEFTAIYRRLIPDSFSARVTGSDPYSMLSDRAAEGIEASGEFHGQDEWRFTWEREYTKADWLDRLPTHGGWSTFSPEDTAAVLTAVGNAIDAAGGSFTMHFNTVAVTATKA
ncbi:class I SAM-dependent methyltransferase [Kibdelosporangium philippinense]|uniref:Class I SAM-dependent methyltransferase n=1 Tax=Kibdelosporangium philippinense TaxID=211113 RepID=A0ABS8Z1S7_9PSEU|nr:class I SAM-dependent methyltransferase [Kibdelosporangium philippinense]MCE7001891.1 class I SAM-dependent methyltransferase [Kibdelosporangium philippinense]